MDEEPITIEAENHGARGRYVVRVSDAPEAEMTWFSSGKDVITIDHTFVPPELRNRGIAEKLVQRGIADARAQGLKIVPACSYVALQFRRHKDWADLLAR